MTIDHHPDARPDQLARARGTIAAPGQHTDAQLRDACETLRALSPDHADHRTANWMLAMLNAERPD